MPPDTSPLATAAPFYITGGNLPPDAPSYVERQADAALYDSLRRSEFCYVLTSRQMGKSSLMVHTATRLRAEGVAVAVVDLTGIGQHLTIEQWYDGLLRQIGHHLDLEDELEEFWFAHARLSPLQRWVAALQEVVLKERGQGLGVRGQDTQGLPTSETGPSPLTPNPSRVVIFIDEIDTVRSLPFSTDEFFAAIRQCYNRRSQEPEFHRLTFCLLGVATPSDLIQDTRTTPFNIGTRIELTDFIPAEAAPLAQGLGREAPLAAALLQRILHWTSGHPYLTQRLCQAVAEANARNPKSIIQNPKSEVDRRCEALFLTPTAREQDDNLLFVRDRLLRSGADLMSLLDLYAKVRSGSRVPPDDTNPLVGLLRLSGVPRVVHGNLRVRNRIYARVFDRAWVATRMPDAELRRQRAAYQRGLLRAAAVSGAILTVVAGLALTAINQAHRADRNARRAATRAYEARMALAETARERDRANREATRARAAEHGERAELALAETARRQAEKAGQEAERQRRSALRQRQTAEARRAEAEQQRHRAQRAEQQATQELWQSYLTQARALRFSGRSGRRFDALAALAKAAAIHPSLALRNEAIACMALPDLRLGRQWSRVPPGSTSLAYDADYRRCVCMDRQGNITIRRLADDREIAHFSGIGLPGVEADAFSQDGRFLPAYYGDDSTAYFFYVWDLSRHRAVLQLKDIPIGRHDFSPDSRRCAIGYHDGSIHLFELPSGHEFQHCPPGGGVPGTLRFDPTGRRLAVTRFGNSSVQVFDVASGQVIRSFSVPARAWSLGWSPDGEVLAICCKDGHIYLWDVGTGERIRTLEGHQTEVTNVAFSHSGNLLASRGWDETVRLWDLFSGKELLAARALFNVWHFSRDDRLLGYARRSLSAPGPSTTPVEVAPGQECRMLYGRPGPNKEVWSVEFSPDGHLLVSAGG